MSWLPQKPVPQVFDPSALRIMLYGRRKIGKTTWCASFPDALFICAEEGHAHLSVTRVSVPSWADGEKRKDENGVMSVPFLQLVDELEQNRNDLPYKTFIVDTADRLYAASFDHACKSKGIEHPSDLKYGKGWDLVGNEFRRGVMRLIALRKGVVFVSHTNTRYVSVGENEVEKKELSLPGKAQQVLLPEVDLILRADYASDPETGDSHRVLIADGTEHTEAGSRWALPPVFPLTKRGGYEKLLSYLKGDQPPAAMARVKLGNHIKLNKKGK